MIFVDTGAWIALSDRKDQYHQRAVTIYHKIKQSNEKLITTDFVIDETSTRLRYDINHPIAQHFLQMMLNAENKSEIEIIYINHSLLEESIQFFSKYDTLTLSFTDCTSFVVCQKRAIHNAFAFDQHFSAAGINLLQP